MLKDEFNYINNSSHSLYLNSLVYKEYTISNIKINNVIMMLLRCKSLYQTFNEILRISILIYK
jgi:hypothetical protein